MMTSAMTTALDLMVRDLDALPDPTPNQRLLRATIYAAYVQGRITETEDEQGDTGVQGDTPTSAPATPPARVAIYNIWDDDAEFCDEWTYDPAEALEKARVWREEMPHTTIHVTRYWETDGNVNTLDDYERVSDDQLVQAIDTYDA